jgi:CRISPR/Cas system endoribonuclease Cas6 (RAMP superfamily)
VRTVKDRLEWRDWERYSARQDTRMRLGGVVGEVMYEGQLGRFLPFLRLGEQVHVGNGTAFGLGAFRIVLHEP